MSPERWRTVSRVADAALDRLPAERAAFIERECAGDAALLHDVERYLTACDQAAAAPGFLTSPAREYATSMLQDLPRRTSLAEAAVPVRLADALAGRYTIERELGRGGMAIVYAARDTRRGIPVAIKVLRPALTQELGAQRFLREIAIVAALEHPQIVPLIDSGEAAGILYFAMPHIEGETLAQLLAHESPLPFQRALAVARDAATALDFAHSRGIVHRDIKPANILLCGAGAKVADFGVAKAIVEAGGDGLTSTGIVVGTSTYMSPEQASSDPRLDGRTDVYALACVVYEMLTGVPPYIGPTPQVVQAKHIRAPIPDVRDICPELSRRLARVIVRGLAKDPADRFSSAGRFIRALESA